MSETEPPPPSRWRGRTILLFSAAGLMVAASAVAIGGRYLAPPPPAVNGNGQATDAHVPGNVRAASAAPVAPSPPVEAPLGPQPLQPESKQKSVRREPAGTPGEAPPSEKNDLIAREIQQMREIRALLGQDPRKALALAEAGHVAFARGMLYEEREAHAILALARLGQVAAARPRAARFLKSSPHGPFSQRVREAVGLR